MAALADRFRAHLERSRLFPAPGLAVVAVSGGVDSVALLDLLNAAADAFALRLVVAHADHEITPGSDTVAEQVRALAARYGLPYEVGRLGLGPRASETVARRARYGWLRDVQQRRGARYLVTAHHRDDQVETILLRALRGSGLAGLAGIPASGRGGLVRPLLPFARRTLAAHVALRELPTYDDPANRDLRHLRSWLRVALLPELETRLGGSDALRRDLVRMGRYAARDRRAWDQALDLVPELALTMAPRGFDVARGVLAGYDAALAAALLGAAARRAGLVLGPGRARQLVAFAGSESGRRFELPGGWVAEIAFDRLRVGRVAGPAPAVVVAAAERGHAVFGSFVVHWEPAPAPATLERSGWTTWIGGPGWQVRPYHPGDRLVPLGGVGRRPVRRLFMEAQVPRTARGHYPVVARGETILWVPGICRSMTDLPSPGTRAVRLDVTEYDGAGADRRA